MPWALILLATICIGCSTKLVVTKVSPGEGNAKGLRYYLTRPYLKVSTFEVTDVYEDNKLGPPYSRVVQETEFLPDVGQMYEVNFRAGLLTKNQFTWTHDDKLASTLKTLAINTESQLPDTLKGLAEIPKGVAVLVKELKPPVALVAGKKIAESVTLKKVEYIPIKEGTVIDR